MIAKYFSFFDIPLISASKMRLKVQKRALFNSTLFGPSYTFLRHFPKEFQKKKSTLLIYFFMLYLNLV